MTLFKEHRHEYHGALYVREVERTFYRDPWSGEQLCALRSDPTPRVPFNEPDKVPAFPVVIKWFYRLITGN